LNGHVCRTIDNETKEVIGKENFFETFFEVHSSKRAHQGITKTYDTLNLQYHGITKECVAAFRRYCYICNLKAIQQSQPRLKPIVSTEIFERAQLDLVDMRCCPDTTTHTGRKYEWIGHMMDDHAGQFHVLWAQETKTGMCMLNYLYALLF